MSAGREVQIQRRLHGTDVEYAKRPYGAVLISTNPQRDQITFEGPRSGRTIPISHPYLGPGSWIRVMPERATRLIVNSRADSGEPFISAYVAEASSQGQIDSTYRDNNFYYRRLREGEIDVSSNGLAQTHWAQGGTLSHRAGPLTSIMSVEKLEINSKAPTIIQRTLDNEVSEISSEIRFGVVKRVNSTDETQDKYVRIQPEGASSRVFAKEYLRNIASKAPPYTLVDHREGHVIDNDGEEMESDVTGKKLRSRTVYGTVQSEQTLVELDEEGNVNVMLPSNASYGVNIDVERTDVKITVGRDEQHNIGRNLLMDVENTATISADDIKMDGQNSIVMNSTSVTLGTDQRAMAHTLYYADSINNILQSVGGAALVSGATSATAATSAGPLAALAGPLNTIFTYLIALDTCLQSYTTTNTKAL
jgi:hypothetical protein